MYNYLIIQVSSSLDFQPVKVFTKINREPCESESDIKMRNVSNSQEVLRVVPGLFIGQHQGGGKAEQIFLRGFDNDHGTDISLNVDGMPINITSWQVIQH